MIKPNKLSAFQIQELETKHSTARKMVAFQFWRMKRAKKLLEESYINPCKFIQDKMTTEYVEARNAFEYLSRLLYGWEL